MSYGSIEIVAEFDKYKSAFFSPQTVMFTGLLLGSLAVGYVTVKMGLIFGLIFSALPLLLYAAIYALNSPYWAYTALFVLNYYIMGMIRYIPSLMGGVVLDSLIMISIAVLLIRSCYKAVPWKNAKTGLMFAALIWFIYCLMELFNPMGTIQGWMTSIRGISLYFFFTAVLTPIIFYRYRDLQRILVIWSILTLTAVLKAQIQRTFGFDAFEKRWLYESGGMTTHIIYSGIRYFSFYTDAGTFGSGMGLAMVVFSIVGLYCKNKWYKLYFFAVAFLAAYGMTISGTRGALIVPFTGYAIYLMISKRTSIMLLGAAALFAAFAFFNFTTIGQGNALIRRMRSTFNRDDASLNVRLDNQKLLWDYMKDKPFGSGLGMGGGKAKAYAPNAFLSQIPTDSWYVLIWTETGIIGLAMHLMILFYALLKGCYLSLFRLKDPELRGIVAALTAGIFGIMVSAYGNEILGQLPTGIIIYMSMAFIFMSPIYDKEIAEGHAHRLRFDK